MLIFPSFLPGIVLSISWLVELSNLTGWAGVLQGITDKPRPRSKRSDFGFDSATWHITDWPWATNLKLLGLGIFFSLSPLWRHTHNKIDLLSHFKVYSSLTLRTHGYATWALLILQNRSSAPIKVRPSFSSPPALTAPALSVSENLTGPGPSLIRYHTAFVLLWLTDFT